MDKLFLLAKIILFVCFITFITSNDSLRIEMATSGYALASFLFFAFVMGMWAVGSTDGD